MNKKDIEILIGLSEILSEHKTFSGEDYRVYNALNSVFNEERWITIKPHGADAEDYKRLKLQDGETPKQAMKRVYKVDLDKKDNGKGKKNNAPKKTFKERIEEKRKGYDLAYAKYHEIESKSREFEQKLFALLDDISDYEAQRKFAAKYREEHKEEEQKLAEERNQAYKNYKEAEKEFDNFTSELADEISNIDLNKLDLKELSALKDDLEDFSYMSGIPYGKRKFLQSKISDINVKLDQNAVKEEADKVGGYTKKLNNLCGFTRFSDISSYPEDLQKHIYDSYKSVYNKYPQIRYGGLQIAELGDRTYANNLSYSNVVTLNKKKYSDLATLKESYDNTVKGQFHPQGTTYNSIITHELGHGLLSYIEKTYKISGVDIRATVLNKIGIKQKDVKEYLSEYAMAKPRKAHEFFAEAFAEYMDSPKPRPLAVAFGEEINRILNSKG